MPYRTLDVDRQARRIQRKRDRHNGAARQARLSLKRRRQDNLSDIIDCARDLSLCFLMWCGIIWYFSLFTK